MSTAQHIPIDRGSPASVEAERTILGAVLIDNAAFYETATLSTLDFSLDSHRTIFGEMVSMLSEGTAVDIITLSESLENSKHLESIGNRAYLFSLTENLPRRLSIADYVRIVKEKSQLRMLMGICQAGQERAADQSESYASIRDHVQQSLLEIDAEDARIYSSAEVSAEAIAMTFGKNGEDQEVFSTGIPAVDEATSGGIRLKELWIWGGLPGRGKTSAARQVGRTAAKNAIPTMIQSCEMSRGEWRQKDAACEVGVPAWKLRKPKYMNPIDRQRIEEYVNFECNKWPVYFDDRSSVTLQSLLAQWKLAIMRHGVRMFLLDYLQLLDGPGGEMRFVLGNIAKRLAQFAKAENVAVIALSQLTSDSKMVNRRPTMQDLNEAKSMGNHAHCILLNYFPLDEEGNWTHDDEIVIGKQRNGPIGPVHVKYDADSGKFLDREVEK